MYVLSKISMIRKNIKIFERKLSILAKKIALVQLLIASRNIYELAVSSFPGITRILENIPRYC